MRRVFDRIGDDAFAARILQRDLIRLAHDDLHGLTRGKTILVTGGGGFIGSALVTLLAAGDPARIVLADNSEFGLYETDRRLREAHPLLSVRTCYCDIRDEAAVDRLFRQERPAVVFHAAAMKHLPLSEDNAREAVLTNVFGTFNVASACRAWGTAAMIHISTDKAAAPTSILGMTKRAAEAVCQMLDGHNGAARIANVRFHNVFASTGSFIPLFFEQLAREQPLTITDPGMTRYFMTGSEAAQLLLLIAARTRSADYSGATTYVLDAGQPIGIMDLARRVLADFGRETGPDAIRIVGARPGEKLDECLAAPWEPLADTRDPYIARIAAPPLARDDVLAMLGSLADHCQTFDEDQIRATLADYTACQAPHLEPAAPGQPA